MATIVDWQGEPDFELISASVISQPMHPWNISQKNAWLESLDSARIDDLNTRGAHTEVTRANQ